MKSKQGNFKAKYKSVLHVTCGHTVKILITRFCGAGRGEDDKSVIPRILLVILFILIKNESNSFLFSVPRDFTECHDFFNILESGLAATWANSPRILGCFLSGLWDLYMFRILRSSQTWSPTVGGTLLSQSLPCSPSSLTVQIIFRLLGCSWVISCCRHSLCIPSAPAMVGHRETKQHKGCSDIEVLDEVSSAVT